jgi:hypothetical protein
MRHRPLRRLTLAHAACLCALWIAGIAVAPCPPYTCIEAAVLLGHLHEPSPRITDARGDLPAVIDAVVAQAMERDPARRWPTQNGLRAIGCRMECPPLASRSAKRSVTGALPGLATLPANWTTGKSKGEQE